MLLCVAWVLLGLVGHDPWKTEDATTFGVAWDMMRARRLSSCRRSPASPTSTQPPLVYALAARCARRVRAACCRPTTPRASPSALLLGADAAAARRSPARELNGRAFALAAGAAVRRLRRALGPRAPAVAGARPHGRRRRSALYGFALALRRPVAGGVALGLGVGVAFLADGFAGPAVARASRALVLPRRRRPRGATARYALTRGDRARRRARRVAAPWPLALRCARPAHLAAWWAANRRSTTSRCWAARGGDPLLPRARTCRGSPGRRCRSRCGRCGRAAAASTAASRDPGRRAARRRWRW